MPILFNVISPGFLALYYRLQKQMISVDFKLNAQRLLLASGMCGDCSVKCLLKQPLYGCRLEISR